MRFIFYIRMTLLLLAALTVADGQAEAQSFSLAVTASASSITVSNSVTYTITVTNLTGLPLPDDTLVTNQFSAPVQFLSADNIYGSVITNGNVAIFDLGEFVTSEISLTIEPTTAGVITNTVTVACIDVPDTASTNVVIQATNNVTQADLGVTLTGPAQTVVTNDLMAYAISATNLGPSAAANVILTNTLPPGVIFKSVSPNQTFTTDGSNLIFNLGTLANGGSANFKFTVQPTNAGVLSLSASIGAAGILDTDTANNSASTNITVIDYLPGTLVAVTNSPQTYDMQNNLVEQSITVTNLGSNAVDAVRVVVTGLTNQLFNAVGTNSGNPFVVFGSSLAAGQSVELLLQYAANNYFPFTNSQLQAFAVPAPNLAAPLVSAASTNSNIISIVKLSSGDILIWFPSISNRTYTVAYSSDLSSTNWLMAQPSVVAPTTFTEWIDYGPPETLSAPTNTSARFYRVFLNP